MNPIILGAPFGNYLQFRNCTSTVGTYTTKYRGGFWKRMWRVLKTVRYYPGIRAWKNRLGLPNEGILCKKLQKSILSDKILSIAGFNNPDWRELIERACSYYPLAVELNLSCPNCPGEDVTNYDDLFCWLAVSRRRTEFIVKLPPVGYQSLVDSAIKWKLRSFHCCNTIPVSDVGGISGKPLMELSLEAVKYVRNALGRNNGMIIGGGGITGYNDIQRYRLAGATNFSIASTLFFPWNWKKVKKMAQVLVNHE